MATPLPGGPADLSNKGALPPFAALRAFEAVGRLGGVRRAAQALSLDHAVVSRHVRSLESWTGVKLLDRLASGGRLTVEGAEYHSRVSAALSDIAAATADLLGRCGERLSICCTPGLESEWLTAELREFRDGDPDLDIELRPTDVSPDFSRREADGDIRYVAFTGGPPPSREGERRVEIARPEIIAVASPAFLAGRRFAGASDLLHAPLLHAESQDQWRAWFWHHQVEAPLLRGPRLWRAHLDAARQGQGVALANAFMVRDDLAAGRLVKIETGRRVVLGAYVFTARADRWAMPSIVRLRRWLERSATAMPEAA